MSEDFAKEKGPTSLPTPMVEGIAEISRQQLPLERTLPLILADLAGGRAERKWKKILKRLEGGEPLSSIAGQDPDLAALIEGGMETGRLGEVLEQSLADRRRLRDLDRGFQGMMIYSLGITTLALLAATQVLAAYMPVYELISRDFGGVLGNGGSAWGGNPTGDFMESLLRLQFWLVKWRWWIAFLPSGAVLLLWVISKGMPLGSMVRYVPCIGAAVYWREFSRCARLLAQFLWAGVTYPRALDLAGRGSRGLSVRLSCQALSKRLSEGVPIREAVLSAESMPDSMTETLVGVEEQGAVCRMLRSLGDLYERRSREAMQWFLLIWEPCVMVLVLGIVGTTLLFLYPLLQVIRAFY